MNNFCLRVNDVIELTGLTKPTVYSAMNAGKLSYTVSLVNGREVRMFREKDVYDAFPKLSKERKDNVRLKAETKRLEFALNELRQAIEILDPDNEVAKKYR
ncbi:helix-turn-helix transcriptional regulator [Vibrio mediterranei]